MNSRRWMVFVDGENLTIRAQEVAKRTGFELEEGSHYKPNVFAWMDRDPKHVGCWDNPPLCVANAVRAYYYTSSQGDAPELMQVRQSLSARGFEAKVFHKPRNRKAKAVDIELTKDFLSHAFLDNYDLAILVAADRDYLPLIEEVKRLGKIVHVAFFESEVKDELRLAADGFFPIVPSHFVGEYAHIRRSMQNP